jgi:cell division protein FtsZ
VARIVDPAVAEEEEGDAPLFAEPAYESRKPRGGFLSLFGGGRPRYDAPASAPAPRASASVRGGAMPLEAAQPEEQAESAEDLEIPSFLRRLAN